MDYTALVSAVDFAGPLTVVAAGALALMGIAIATRGAGIALKFIRG